MVPPMKATPLLLICGALALFAAGCGGDDEDSASTTSAESAARGYDETIATVNDICARATAEIDAVGKDITGKAGENDAELIGQVAEINDKYIAELREIEPDPELAPAFDAFAEAIDAQLAATRAAGEAASGSQAEYEAALQAVGTADGATDAAARTLGADDCGKD